MLGLRTVIYKAPDSAKAKAWYTRVFELDPDASSEKPAGGSVAYWGVPVASLD